MATFLDVGLLQHFSKIFSFLLVFLLVYAFFQYTKTLGDNKGLHSLISLSIAILLLFSPLATDIIENMAPWFVVLFVFVIFLLMAYKLFGIEDAHIAEAVKGSLGIKWAIFIVILLVLMTAISMSIGPQLLGQKSATTAQENATTVPGKGVATDSFGENVKNVLFHPKVIGMVFVLLIAVATIGLVTSVPKRT